MKYTVIVILLVLSLTPFVCGRRKIREDTENENTPELKAGDGSEVKDVKDENDLNLDNENYPEDHKKADTTTTSKVPTNTNKVSGEQNKTDSKNVTQNHVNGTAHGPSTWYGKVIENKGMLMRTFYVLLGVSSIVVIYFVVRAWRIRRKHSKSRKYGLITSGADLEMEPLDQNNDDDDEMTMFERRK